MPYIEWNDSMSVGIVVLDEQHRKLLDAINRLHQAMLDNRGKELQKEIIYEMYDYAYSHFAMEELYMRRFNFAGCEEHCLEHEQFVKEVTDLKNRADKGGLILTISILSFLKDWLKNHIFGTDMKYAEFFHQQGLT